MEPVVMRSPAEIVDDLAAKRGMVTPIRDYMALSRDFAEACIILAVAEALAEVKANKEGSKER